MQYKPKLNVLLLSPSPASLCIGILPTEIIFKANACYPH